MGPRLALRTSDRLEASKPCFLWLLRAKLLVKDATDDTSFMLGESLEPFRLGTSLSWIAYLAILRYMSAAVPVSSVGIDSCCLLGSVWLDPLSFL
jgi:hypothetical protein